MQLYWRKKKKKKGTDWDMKTFDCALHEKSVSLQDTEDGADSKNL